ncbi:uncharacterized protein [Montipora foliosa]|uniref:uncharacterized protein n=1 Tax=Montipora foliosa TaxID=591990 RepID=UPI0035F1D51F
MIQTKGVKVDILESLTPYSLWNEYRSRYTDMYKKPSKVLVHMNNFEEIYLELLSEFRFGEFYQDYMEKSVCDETNIRACMDELKELADNTPDNFYGDAFIRLRNFFTRHNPGLFTDDDREFRSPIKGLRLGKPFSELGQDQHENVWMAGFDLRSPNEIGSDVFSPLQAPQATFSQTNGSDKRTKDAEEFLFPHELRRRKRLRQQQLYFEHMTEQIKEQREAECTIERVHQPTKETFVENYMNRGKPVILTGMMDSWDAMKSWDFKQLGMILTKGVKVDILESLTPYSLWNEYRSRHTDMHKKPSKVHMNNFEEIYPELLSEFRFPEFYQDYMEVVDEDIRPVRLSFEMAPRRSGFHWRVESINASVWSALILGRKRWGLYPPSQYFVPGVVSNDHRSQDSQKSESFLWWAHTLPHLMEDYKPFECSQRLGEIFYIPSGWWWSNVNMDDSITLQKSVCDETNIRACMDELKELADNTPDNFYGDAFIQLRHFFTKHNPGLLTDDDREFRSPIKGLGKPFSELGQDHHEYVWKKYFEDEKDASAEDSSDNEPHKKG